MADILEKYIGQAGAERGAAVFLDVTNGEVLWQGRGGQSLIEALTFFTDPAQVAATGWGGDAMTVYLDESGAECLRWDLVGDTDAHTAEIFDGLAEWAAGVDGTVEVDGGVVRVDRCA